MDIFREFVVAVILLSVSHLCHAGPVHWCDDTELYDPDFGFVHVLASESAWEFPPGTIAEYGCEDGYRLVGRDWRECLHDGSWSGHVPMCEEAYCDPDALGTLDNGGFQISYQDGGAQDCPVETIAYYYCNHGYYLSGGDEEHICVNDDNGHAVWDGTMPECLDIRQPVPGSWSAWEVTSPCSVTCGEGVRQERRRCSGPPPSHGGATCRGQSEKYVPCRRNLCEAGATTLSSQGNPHDGNPTSKAGGSNIVPIIAGSVAGVVFLLAIILTAVCLARRRHGIARQMQGPRPHPYAKEHVDISTVYDPRDSLPTNHPRRGGILPVSHENLIHNRETTQKERNLLFKSQSSKEMANRTKHLQRVSTDSASSKAPKNSRRETEDHKPISVRSSPKVFKAPTHSTRETEYHNASKVLRSERKQDSNTLKKKSHTQKSKLSRRKADTNGNTGTVSPVSSVTKSGPRHLQADKTSAIPNVYNDLPDSRPTYEHLSGRSNRNHEHKYEQLTDRHRDPSTLHKRGHGSKDSHISKQPVMNPPASDYTYVQGSGNGRSTRTQSSQGSQSYDYVTGGDTTYLELESEDLRSRVSGPSLPTRPS